MDKDVKQLLLKFNNLKKKGYVKSVTNYKNGSGITLEYYLNSTGGDICIPDFGSIELKTITDYPNAEIHLFNSSPDGKYIFPTQWLSEKYGYPDRDYKNIKKISGSVKATDMSKIGCFFYFLLRVDRINRKIFLEIYNKNGFFLNSDIYWDFDSISEKLIRKTSKISIIKNTKLVNNGKNYYFYRNIHIYQLRSFETFIDLIEKGIITVTFKTGVYKTGKKIGKFHDHGTSFDISIKDIELLYNKIY